MTRGCVRLFVLCLFMAGTVSAAGSGMKVGGNLWFHADWNLQTTFVDVFKSARQFGYTTMNDPGTAWNPYPWPTVSVPATIADGSEVPKDENGYPTEVPVVIGGQQYRPVTNLMCEQLVSNFPYGTWTFLCEGKGEIHLAWNHEDTIVATGGTTRKQFTINQGDITFTRELVDKTPVAAGITLTIVRSDKADHIRNIRVVMPGYENTHETQIFDPRFLDALRPFSPIRFMDWSGANDSKQTTWEQRVTTSSYCQTGEDGVALEYMIEICNRINCDFWYNMPPRADDNFQTEAARMIKARLKPNLKLYLEWANETWNGNFEGKRVGDERAPALGISTWCYNGVAAALMFRNFHAVYGDNEMATRVVKVLAGQCGNDGVLDCVFAAFFDARFNPDNIQADVATVSAYWDGPAGPDLDALDRAKAQAEAKGMKLVAYEGGFSAPNFGTGIYDNYKTVLSQLSSRLDVFNQYTIIGKCNGLPCWGAMEYLGQPLSEAYKYRALYEWQVDHGWFDPSASEVAKPVPAPASTEMYTGGAIRVSNRRLEFSLAAGQSIEVINAAGARVTSGAVATGRTVLLPGIYIVKVSGSGLARSCMILVR